MTQRNPPYACRCYEYGIPSVSADNARSRFRDVGHDDVAAVRGEWMDFLESRFRHYGSYRLINPAKSSNLTYRSSSVGIVDVGHDIYPGERLHRAGGE